MQKWLNSKELGKIILWWWCISNSLTPI